MKIAKAQRNSQSLHFGFLLWWTIRQGNYSVENLKDSGRSQDLPEIIQRYIKGANEKSSWVRATQLGAKGIESDTGDFSLVAKYQTRNVKKDESGNNQRILYREVVDTEGISVSAEELVVISHENDRVVFSYITGISDQTIRDELAYIKDRMQKDMDSRLGNMDDTRIRQAIMRWLESRHRICVRGTGGVYFIPVLDNSPRATEILEEIQSIREWIEENSLGVFSVVKLTNDGATSIEDFRQSAIEEILAEIEEINENLTRYKSNPDMADGSLMYSSGKMVERLKELKQKVVENDKAMKGVIDRIDSHFQMTWKRARKINRSASNRINVQRQSKSDSQKKSGYTGKRIRKTV